MVLAVLSVAVVVLLHRVVEAVTAGPLLYGVVVVVAVVVVAVPLAVAINVVTVMAVVVMVEA